MTKGRLRNIRTFNPGKFESDEKVKELFVVREYELNVVLDVLRGNLHSDSCQHALIVGPRGRGKTMLLARTAAEIRTNPEFNEFLLPVRFMEENREIFNLEDFWLETLYHVAGAIATRNPELSRELENRHTAICSGWSKGSLEEPARAAVLEAADQADCKLVLMVENLQKLCKYVDKDFGWKLRGALQTEPQIILLASATSRFAGLDDASEPFFEIFRVVNLKPLTTDECRRLWQVVSGDRLSGRRMRPLEILTGGNPRLLVIVAGFSLHKSLRQLMEELVMLIDRHTEYFRSNLETLGKTEGRVYIAILDLWQPSSPGEISARARMDGRTVSTMLGRLVDRGALVVYGSGKKRQYAAAEPLFSFYFKLRRSSDEAAIVENLIRFMTVFYSEDEKTAMYPLLLSEARESSAIREGLDRAAAGMPELAKHLDSLTAPTITPVRTIEGDSSQIAMAEHQTHTSKVDRDLRSAIQQHMEEIRLAAKEMEFNRVIELADRFVSAHRKKTGELWQPPIAWTLIAKGRASTSSGDLDAALLAFGDVVQRFGGSVDRTMQVLVAQALIHGGHAQRLLGDLDSALLAFEEVVQRIGSSRDNWRRLWVGRALICKGLTLHESGDNETALLVFKEVAKRYGKSKSVDIQQNVAQALHFLADITWQLGNIDSAASILEEIVLRFEESSDAKLQQFVAKALISIGLIREDLGELIDARAACDKVVDRYGAIEKLRRWAADALLIKGRILRASGDLELAESTYGEIVERYGSSEDQELDLSIARALEQGARLHEELGNPDQVVLACDDLMGRFGTREDLEIAPYIARALGSKGNALRELGNVESAISVFNESLKRFGCSEDSEVNLVCARTHIDKGRALVELQHLDAAIGVYEESVARFGKSKDTELLWWVALAMRWKALIHLRSGNEKAALTAYDDLVNRFQDEEDSDLQESVLDTRINRAELLTLAGSAEDAVRELRELELTIRDLDEEWADQMRWRARYQWTVALLNQNDLEAALELFRSLNEEFEPSDEHMMRLLIKLPPKLIAAGASAADVLESLSSDQEKARAMAPLLVALRQHAGEAVRAPEEVMKVASDIRALIDGEG